MSGENTQTVNALWSPLLGRISSSFRPSVNDRVYEDNVALAELGGSTTYASVAVKGY